MTRKDALSRVIEAAGRANLAAELEVAEAIRSRKKPKKRKKTKQKKQ